MEGIQEEEEGNQYYHAVRLPTYLNDNIAHIRHIHSTMFNPPRFKKNDPCTRTNTGHTHPHTHPPPIPQHNVPRPNCTRTVMDPPTWSTMRITALTGDLVRYALKASTMSATCSSEKKNCWIAVDSKTRYWACVRALRGRLEGMESRAV